ncbi:MAG: hypothetical protein QM582_17410 [Micropruina sp.]|uniref:hypothetical protein n=1 Tax=Micropruina sp. TaxID=2737536 RepID=UPI0039E6642B
MILVLAGFGGCTAAPGPSGDASQRSIEVPVAPGGGFSTPIEGTFRGVLDWGNATIELPLDRYGMSPREEQLVVVARSIVYARCVHAKGEIGPEELREARRYLAMPPDANHWLFGYWNASYLAKHGLGASAVHTPRAADADQATAARCEAEPDHRELEPIGASYQPDDEQMAGVMRWSGEAFDATLADRRFAALIEQMRACLQKSRLAVDGETGLGGAEVDSTWTDARVKQALLAEASCRDAHDITRQTADIAAEIQGPYVRDNLAALTNIRMVATQRVAKATMILRQVGLLKPA